MIRTHNSKSDRWRKTCRKPGEAGQAIVFMLLVLGLFLLGAIAFSVDMGNLWFHRQAAQSAADAACVAGAMDMLVDAQGGATGHQGFTIGTAFDCAAHSAYIPCKYAALNGYDGANATPGNQVYVSFPSTVAGATAPPAGISPQSPGGSAYPFMRVDVLDHVQTYFAGMLSGSRTQDVRAFAACGTVLATSPIPLLVLDPVSPSTTPAQSAFSIQGNPLVKIVGGPTQSIQVNSKLNVASCGASNCSVNLPWGSAHVDLSQGGPPASGASIGGPGTGSDFGLYGGPTTAPTGFLPGTTGHWVPHSPPLDDPFAQVCYPGQTSNCNTTINGNSAPVKPSGPVVPDDEKAAPTGKFTATTACTAIPCSVGYKDHGCPETTAVRGDGKCLLYTPGLYDSTTGFSTGIQVGPGGSTTGITALFDPGLYYIVGGLDLKSNSTVRPGTGVGDGSGGVVFYFSGSGTVTVASDSGSKAKDPFNTMTGPHDSSGAAYGNSSTVPIYTNATTYQYGVRCASGSNMPTNLKGTGTGVDIGVDSSGNPTGANLLLGACTGYYGDPLGASDPNGLQREYVFFQDRAATSVNPSWGGGGQFLLAGTMYFHSCNADGSGLSCGTAAGAGGTFYNDVFSLTGNSGSSTYVLGQIVTDNLTLGGTSGITMDLNPNVVFNILKATLLR